MEEFVKVWDSQEARHRLRGEKGKGFKRSSIGSRARFRNCFMN